MQLCGELFGREVSTEDPIDLDSLERAELAFALEERLGVRLTADLSFRTLSEAAGEISSSLNHGYPPPQPLADGIGHLQWLGEAALRKALTRYYRLEVTGAENVPAAGPAVLAMNHDSLLDIPLLAIAAPRRVWFMAKAELFSGGFSSWFFHVLGGFPVRRGGFDLTAIRAGLEVVRRGGLLGMYPEGTRGPALGPFLPGAAWVALATGVPLIPAAISGTAEAMPRGSPIPRRTRARLRFGEAMQPGREDESRVRLEQAREVTAELRSAVEVLLAL